jgi:hypothetical protein
MNEMLLLIMWTGSHDSTIQYQDLTILGLTKTMSTSQENDVLTEGRKWGTEIEAQNDFMTVLIEVVFSILALSW